MGCTVVAQMIALIMHWYLVNILLIGMNHDYGFIVVPSSGERRWWLDVHWWHTTGGQDVPGIVGTVDRGKGRMSVGKPDGHVGVYPDNKVHGVNMVVHFSAHISKWELVCKFGVIFHIFIISCPCSWFHVRNQWFFYSVITFSYTKCFVHSYTVDVVFALSYGTHLGPVGPRWAPCLLQKPCYQGRYPTGWQDVPRTVGTAVWGKDKMPLGNTGWSYLWVGRGTPLAGSMFLRLSTLLTREGVMCLWEHWMPTSVSRCMFV